jgi:hypothetical protein
VESVLPIYILLYNQLTIPIEQRTNDNRPSRISSKEFNENVPLQAMLDVLQPNITLYGEFNETSLEVFERINDKIISVFERILMNTNYKYYLDIRQSIVNIIDVSLQPSFIPSCKVLLRQDKVLKILKSMMENYDGNPIIDLYSDKYDGNLFLQPLKLYGYLYLSKGVIQNYIKCIEQLKQEK